MIDSLCSLSAYCIKTCWHRPQSLRLLDGSVGDRPNRCWWGLESLRGYTWLLHTKFEQKSSSQSKVTAKRVILICQVVYVYISVGGGRGRTPLPPMCEPSSEARYIQITLLALTFECEELFCSNLVWSYPVYSRRDSNPHQHRFGLSPTEPSRSLRLWGCWTDSDFRPPVLRHTCVPDKILSGSNYPRWTPSALKVSLPFFLSDLTTTFSRTFSEAITQLQFVSAYYIHQFL